MKIGLSLFLGFCISFGVLSQEVASKASVDFKIRNIGVNVDGHFNNASITTNFSSQDISQWVLYGNVTVSSIDTDIKKRDAHLNSDDYFDSATYPEITIKATNFKKTSDNKYDVTIDLTIKDTTKSITIPMEISTDKNGVNLTSYFEINRLDYGVGERSFVLSNTVKINVSYTLNTK